MSVQGRSNVDSGSVQGRSKVGPRSVQGRFRVGPGSVQGRLRSVHGQSEFGPGSVPGRFRVSPRSVRGRSRVGPRSVQGRSEGMKRKNIPQICRGGDRMQDLPARIGCQILTPDLLDNLFQHLFCYENDTIFYCLPYTVAVQCL